MPKLPAPARVLRAGLARIRRLGRGVRGRLRLLRADTPRYSAFAVEQLLSRGGEPRGRLFGQLSPRTRAALREGRYLHPEFAVHAAREAPPASVSFVAVCNDKYAPGLEALLLSLLRVYPGMESEVVVYHDGGLSPLSMDRLRGIHPRTRFIEDDPERYAVTMGAHHNHRRVGRLGYLTLAALAMTEPSHVILLDTDLLVLGDISPLWRTERLALTLDVGVVPFGIVSGRSRQPVLNSGVISLPRSERGPEAVAHAERVLAALDENDDPDIAHFADQKFWNVYAWERGFELLPQNFNAIKSLAVGSHRHELGDIKILHLTGPKPWYDFVFEGLLGHNEPAAYRSTRQLFPAAFALWDQLYRSEIVSSRAERFLREEEGSLEALRGTGADRPVVLIGNGPSIARTDLGAFRDYTRVAFNWFTLHEEFDRVRPDHLVLPSHMLYGGWHTPRPELPEAYLSSLLRHEHRPRLWTSFFFKPYLETVAELADYEISYFLFEKPFKRFVTEAGRPQLDLRAPLADAHTGVLTAGVPIALWLGASSVVLTGCDSNYSSTSGSYFYPSGAHASRTTQAGTLLSTWRAGGPAEFGYAVTRDALAERGVGLWDTTIDGRLTSLPRLSLEEARALGGASRIGGGAGVTP